MIALFRYAYFKSVRDHLLAALLLTPPMMVFAPLFGLGLLAAITRHGGFPFVLGPQNAPGTTATLLSSAAVTIATLVAGVGAFMIFRTEVATRAIGLFLLAGRTRAVAATAAIYGAAAGIVSYLLALMVIGALTLERPLSLGHHLAVAVVASCAAAAAGVLMVSLSAEVTMLVPLYAVGAAVAVGLLQVRTLLPYVIALAAAVVVAAITPLVMRRACAA